MPAVAFCMVLGLATLSCPNVNELENFVEDNGGHGIKEVMFKEFVYTDLELLRRLDLPELDIVVVGSGTCSVRKEAPCIIQWVSSTTATTSTSFGVTTTISIEITGSDKLLIGCVVGLVLLVVVGVVTWLVKTQIQIRRRRLRRYRRREAQMELLTNNEDEDTLFEREPPDGLRTTDQPPAAAEASAEAATADSLV